MKKNYIQPSSILQQMHAAPMMATVSGSLSETEYTGEAGAKQDGFDFAFEEDENGNTNTTIIATRKYFNLWED